MTSTAALLSQQIDPSALTSICRPLPGYRLAFIPIAKFLEQCFTIVFGASFRTARPLKLSARDLRLPFLGSEEIDTVNQFKALKKQVEWMAGRLAAKQLARNLLNHRPGLQDTRIE